MSWCGLNQSWNSYVYWGEFSPDANNALDDYHQQHLITPAPTWLPPTQIRQ
jgi:hypothetical protein